MKQVANFCRQYYLLQ